MATAAAMIGAVTMSRVPTDQKLSDSLLQAVEESTLLLYLQSSLPYRVARDFLGLLLAVRAVIVLVSSPDPVLRQAIEKQMDRIEHVHRFTRAVHQAAGIIQAEKEDQEMAEACKRLIKNCIICWNSLYLSQKLEEITDAESREALLDAVADGSTVAWRHLNLLGEYDFSAEKLRDSVGIRLPKLGG